MTKAKYVLTTAILALFVTFAAAVSNMAHAAGRYALVIGNSNYSFAPLRNPTQDAALMAATLRVLGFDVSEYLDVPQRDLKRAVVDFGRKLEQAGKDAVGLVYYAGHGVQVRGENYLIPIGANIRDELDVDIEGVRASIILSALERAGNSLNIVILDACRNNPFQSNTRAVNNGLARMDAPSGTLLAYSTSPGNVAEDGSGRNSPYTQALAQSMRTQGAKVEDVFKRVRISVMERTNSRQVPWESSSLTGDFYFVDDGDGGQVALPTPQQGTTATDQAVEIEYWKSIANSDNPDLFKSYLSAFPNGLFRSIAEKRVAELGGAGATQPAQTLGGQTPAFLWESIKDSSDPTVFQAFVAEFPTGFYSRLAKARLDALGGPPVTASTSRQAPPEQDLLEVDLRFWEAIGNSNRRGDYLAYLQKFPNGQFAALAQARLAELDKNKVAQAAPQYQTQPAQPTVVQPATTTQPAVTQPARQPAAQQVAVAPAVTSSTGAGAAVARGLNWGGTTWQLDSGGEQSLLCNPEAKHTIKMKVEGGNLTGSVTAPQIGSVSIRATVKPNGRFHGKMFYTSVWSISGNVHDDKIDGKFWNPLSVAMCRGAFELRPE